MNTPTEPTQEAPTQASTSSPAKRPQASSKVVWIVVVVVLVALAALLVLRGGMIGDTTMMPSGDESATGDPSSVVATVNGVSITRSELMEKADQIRATVPPGSIGDESVFQQQVLDEIINLQLLLSAAETRGITVDDGQVDAEIASLVELFGGQESFDTQLTATGLTLDDLRANMRNELIIRSLVDADTNIADIEVTDEEVKAAYDLAFASGGQDTPTFEQVGEMLRAQLVRQKSEAIINAYIETVRSTATVETFL